MKIYNFYIFNRFRIDDNIPVKVEYHDGLYSVVALVISRLGIVYSKEHDCQGDTKCLISIEMSDKMLPQAKLLIYNFRDFNQQILHGSTTIKFNQISTNFVSIIRKYYQTIP